MKIIICVMFIMLSISILAIDLRPVGNVDIERYSGKWFEFAKYPNRFQRNCKISTATYTLKENGDIKVFNECITLDNSYKNIRGRAWIPNLSEPGKLKVRFFWPFSANYWIVGLDEDYYWAIVSEPKKRFLWILTRDTSLSKDQWKEIEKVLLYYDFEIERLEFTYSLD